MLRAVCLACLASHAAAGEAVTEALSFSAPFDEINQFSGMRHAGQWEVGGSAVVHRSFVRLTAERQGQKGWMVSHTPVSMSDWGAMLELRASGQSPHLYGDGLAIWLVATPDHIEGPVFGREDQWKGLGVFFDTFQNLDHSHHHKHPYIYAMLNDGTKGYIPDAEKPDPAKQVLPGAAENSGCSYDFRYGEDREDVSVLNHTRVHLTYKNKVLKMRLQQTSNGVFKEWYNCFEMKDVEIPANAYFGVSSATGDLVDNHDIIAFNVRNLAEIKDPEADYDAWAQADLDQQKQLLEEFDLRPAEAMQRDYQRVLRAQAAAIKGLTQDVEKLKQQLEFQMAALNAGIVSAKKNLDAKTEAIGEVTKQMEEQTSMKAKLESHAESMSALRKSVEAAGSGGSSLQFYFLLLCIVALAGVGYNRYRKIMKSHLL